MENSSENNDSLSCNSDSSQQESFSLQQKNKNEIFTINKKIEDEVKEKCGVPHWGSMIFGLFNKNLRKKLIETSKINEAYYNFILGVQQEYGIDCEINLPEALEFYFKAARLKDTYALHKLYNVYCYEYEKFQVQRDREKELFFIFQSIAYSDASFFINNDTFFKIDISYEISLICELEEKFFEKFSNLFQNIKELESDTDEITFIESFISLKYLNDKHDVDYAKQLECVDKLKKLAEKKHLEASYKLAVVFRMSKQTYIVLFCVLFWFYFKLFYLFKLINYLISDKSGFLILFLHK